LKYIAIWTHIHGINVADAKTISDDILSNNDEILGISIMDMRGNILAAKSKESFRKAFAVSRDRAKYGGTLAVAALAVANETRNIFGAAKAIITIHENCKLMLLPVPPYQLLVGLVLQRSVNTEDKIANKVERLVAHTLDRSYL
jgi:hypothetical protein